MAWSPATLPTELQTSTVSVGCEASAWTTSSTKALICSAHVWKLYSEFGDP